MTDRAWGAPFETGGVAAVFAHPDDETFGCAGALALAADQGRVTRLLIATRGEAGTVDGSPDPAMGDQREDELRCAAGKIGLNEVSVLEGYPDGGVADQPFDHVITLCDKVREVCPDFGDHPRFVHWSIPDPAVTGDADDDVQETAPDADETEDLTDLGRGHAAVHEGRSRLRHGYRRPWRSWPAWNRNVRVGANSPSL